MEGNLNLQHRLDELRSYFAYELGLLKNVCSNANLSGRAQELRIVIASACTTGTALFEIGYQPLYFSAEMMMLGRSFIEKITNFCYLQICNESEFNKFLLHAYYRGYHNLERAKHAGNKSISFKAKNRNKIKSHPKVAEALDVFSETNPRKSWSNLSLDEKVTEIGKNTSISIEFFLLNTLSIYSNASEALHGSLFGCAVSTGAFSFSVDTSDTAQVESYALQNTALLYVQLGSMIHETIILLSQHSKIHSILTSSTENQKIALNHLKGIFREK